MLIREKSKQDRPDAPAENSTMVSAIFGAVADFAEPAEEKLKAVIRAGQIAEAFLAGANARHRRLRGTMKECAEMEPRVNAGPQIGQHRTAD